MEKDESIISLIEKFKDIIDFNLVEIVDYWDTDLCAIGIKKGNKLVYISTFNFFTEKIVRYDYDLEILDESDENKTQVIEEGRGVYENEILQKLQTFLEV